jgi:hypothetical protein
MQDGAGIVAKVNIIVNLEGQVKFRLSELQHNT